VSALAKTLFAIYQLVIDTLAEAIPLSSDQISELARQINETVRSLTDIDSILNATADDLAKTAQLSERADNARYCQLSILHIPSFPRAAHCLLLCSG